jgi:hypothetical protein
MVSSVSGTPTTAMTVMPFVLIVQLVLSGVLFQLSGMAESFSYITLSKWGMSAFGAEADLNHITTSAQQKLAELPNAGLDLSNPLETDFYQHKLSCLLTAWGACYAITVFNAVVCVVALKIKNKDS